MVDENAVSGITVLLYFIGLWQYLRATIHTAECSIGLPFRREDVSARLWLSGRFKKGIPRIVHCRTGDSNISRFIVEEILLIRVMVAPTLQLTVPILSLVCACNSEGILGRRLHFFLAASLKDPPALV